MYQKKAPVIPIPARNLRKELEGLYARRCVLDHLIESLEQYERCREKELSACRLRMA
jgi:hypothetical protein